MVEKQKVIFSEFLKIILPELITTVQKNIDNAEIIFLSLKILWKSVHYDMPQDVKELTITWMELIILVIKAHSE